MNNAVHPRLNSIWRTPRRIVTDLLDTPDPRTSTQALSPQAVYSIVAQMGISGAVDVLELASREQIAAIIDFHIWNRDEIDIEKLLEILSCTDATDSLDLLGKIIRSIDLKIIALLISRYVTVVTLDEPSETPFEEGFVTPDNGSTWLRVETTDNDIYFNVSRVIAYIYESNIHLFYQLVAIPTMHTASVLEEEAYLEREKRLQALGFPDEEVANEICTPLTAYDLKVALHKGQTTTNILVSESEGITLEDSLPNQLSPLLGQITSRSTKLLGLVRDVAEFEAEFGFLLNCSLMRWHVDLSSIQSIKEMAERVQGANYFTE